MDILAKGLSFYSPDQCLQYSTISIVFADDNTNINNDFLLWIQHPPLAQTVLHCIQQDSQTWERCLYTSGGKLKLIKYKYYLMIWKFNAEGKAELTPANELPTMLLMSGIDTKQHKMTQLNCSTAQETLGAKTAPSLQTNTALTSLTTKIQTYAIRLITSALTKLETYTAHHAVFIPAMTYTFPVMYHQKRLRCNTIISHNSNITKIRIQSTHCPCYRFWFQ